MILSDREIKKFLAENKIQITPAPNIEEQVGSASLDLRLGDEFMIFEHTKNPYIDTRKPETFSNITHLIKVSENEPFVFQPGEFVLSSTLEEIFLPDDIAARIDGRSSLGRLGIVIHSTAGHIDPGFKGKIVLEMENIGMIPILLYPQTRICQLVFEMLSSPTTNPYYKKKNAKYIGAQSPQESKLETN
ncbi:MAG TPA: dCTP deaminase [Candidatus Pacearchaeota archaeon]|jgi:dCTP deaminase|nr:dCTP deaminase [Candidatus Pacearchaeota archaeon]HRR94709.1 dCTP deaminase [Candidatus Paceibacterota bacterium]HPC30487.1 dCTP deaminase [Candidatus Pacearchaeota archaeon]HQG09224.1 dCTP deaminase [Candidatus Pacearchaeota archaeon]HQH20158.1 dCTP deaminase [Candidatus Pacearchaeota archaeon]